MPVVANAGTHSSAGMHSISYMDTKRNSQQGDVHSGLTMVPMSRYAVVHNIESENA